MSSKADYLKKYLEPEKKKKKKKVKSKGFCRLTLIREFLGPSPSAFSGKKNPESSLVTSHLGLSK